MLFWKSEHGQKKYSSGGTFFTYATQQHQYKQESYSPSICIPTQSAIISVLAMRVMMVQLHGKPRQNLRHNVCQDLHTLAAHLSDLLLHIRLLLSYLSRISPASVVIISLWFTPYTWWCSRMVSMTCIESECLIAQFILHDLFV